jgi:Flp pilus assembly protein TadG
MEPTQTTNPMPTPTPQVPVSKPSRKISLHLILTIFLFIGMLLFGALAVIAYNDSQTIHQTLDERTAAAKSAASEAQKKIDDEANRKANELPYKTYSAAAIDGGFQIQIPKSWSIYVGRNTTGATQLDLLANPDEVTVNLQTGGINTQALDVTLYRRSQQDVVKGYNDKIKAKKLSSKGITVSGISGTWLEGSIDDQRHTGVVVIIPVRDKTMVFSTEDMKYIDEFKKILDSAKIVP